MKLYAMKRPDGLLIHDSVADTEQAALEAAYFEEQATMEGLLIGSDFTWSALRATLKSLGWRVVPVELREVER